MRAVVDTNVIASRYMSPTGVPAMLLKRWQEEAFELVTSEPILQECERVLGYAKVRRYTRMSTADIHEAIQSFREFAILVHPTEEVTVVARDPDDDKFIACALAGRAEYIVSGDNDLLKIKRYQSIHILTPAKFLTLLEQEHLEAA